MGYTALLPKVIKEIIKKLKTVACNLEIGGFGAGTLVPVYFLGVIRRELSTILKRIWRLV